VRQEYLFKPPARLSTALLNMLDDPRDAPVMYLLCNQLCMVIPSVCMLFILPSSHLVGVMYFAANYAVFLQRFMLMLHFTEHRRLFRKGLLDTTCRASTITMPTDRLAGCRVLSAQQSHPIPPMPTVRPPICNLPIASRHHASRGKHIAGCVYTGTIPCARTPYQLVHCPGRQRHAA
jgi:hypothetical protein